MPNLGFYNELVYTIIFSFYKDKMGNNNCAYKQVINIGGNNNIVAKEEELELDFIPESFEIEQILRKQKEGIAKDD